MNETDPARARFAILNLVRFGGLALALLGVTIVAKRWIEPADLVGYLLIAVGAFDVIVLPQILARRWRSK